MSTGKKQTEEGKKRKKTQKVLFLAVRFPVDGYWGGGIFFSCGRAHFFDSKVLPGLFVAGGYRPLGLVRV